MHEVISKYLFLCAVHKHFVQHIRCTEILSTDSICICDKSHVVSKYLLIYESSPVTFTVGGSESSVTSMIPNCIILNKRNYNQLTNHCDKAVIWSICSTQRRTNGHIHNVRGIKGKCKVFLARSLPVENLLPQLVGPKMYLLGDLNSIVC